MVERARFIASYLEVVSPRIRDKKARGRLDARTSVIDSGLIDSFALADVIAALEAALGVTLPVDRLVPGDFDTAELLADRLTRLAIVG